MRGVGKFCDFEPITGHISETVRDISVHIPPRPPPPKKNQSTLIFVCDCSVSLQGLVNIYTHPNQIPGYASAHSHAHLYRHPIP